MLKQRDRWPHKHGKIEHVHAWASIEHSHLLRGICGDEACKGCETHNIHQGRVVKSANTTGPNPVATA